MASVIHIPDGIDPHQAVFNSRLNDDTRNFLMNQYSQFTDFGSVSSSIKESFERAKFTVSEYAQNAIERTVSFVGGVFADNVIRELKTMHEFQTVTGLSTRWVMAEEQTRQRWVEQRLDGYAGVYKSIDKTVGKDNNLWRMARDSMVEFDAEGNWSSTNYSYDVSENEGNDLTVAQRFIIERMWERQRAMLADEGEDFTSIDGNYL